MAEAKVGQRYRVETSPVSGIPDGGMVEVAGIPDGGGVIVFQVAPTPTLDMEAGGIVDRPQTQHFFLDQDQFNEFKKTTAKMRDTTGEIIPEPEAE